MITTTESINMTIFIQGDWMITPASYLGDVHTFADVLSHLLWRWAIHIRERDCRGVFHSRWYSWLVLVASHQYSLLSLLRVYDGDRHEFLDHFWLSLSHTIGFNAKLTLIVSTEGIDLPSVSPYYSVIVATSSLCNKFVSETFNKDRSIPTADVIMPQLTIVIEPTREDFAIHCNKHRVMQPASCLNDLTRRETTNDLRCNLMAGVFLTQLSVVIPSNWVNLCMRFVLYSPLLSHNDRMIVAAWYINDLRITDGIHKCRCREIGLRTMTELAIVIIATGIQSPFLSDQCEAFTPICWGDLGNPGVLKAFYLLRLWYPIIINNSCYLRSVVAVAQLPTSIEPYCMHLTRACKDSDMLISRSDLWDVEIIKESHLCWCVSLIRIPCNQKLKILKILPRPNSP